MCQYYYTNITVNVVNILILIRFQYILFPDISLDFAFSWHGMGCLD